MVADLLIRRARLRGQVGDLRCVEGRLTELAPRLVRHPGEEELDAAGGEVVAGLVDHHVHLRALAAAGTSVLAGPPEVNTAAELAGRLAGAAARLAPGGWLRAVGYHESVAGVLDAVRLDALVADRPVRLQHRGGSLWMLNTAGLEALGVADCAETGVERDDLGRPTGRLWRMDAWLGRRVERGASDLGAISRRAAAWGVTAMTDATADRSQAETDELAAACADGVIVQRLCLMSPLGVTVPEATAGRVVLGPVKVLLDDVDLPVLDELADRFGRIRGQGRCVAVHCVTRVQLVLTMAAFALAGARPGDRIEHGALIGQDQFAGLRSLGVSVVTQPGLVATRGDRYLQDVPPEDLDDLWRLGSLCRAGITVALGTDAPYGAADPWVTLRAAEQRSTASGAVIGGAERIGRADALALMAGSLLRPGRTSALVPGIDADLCVVQDGVPTHTVIAGNVVFRA